MDESTTREILTAIAVLQNDISYMKGAIDDLKKEDCSECDPAKNLKDHIEHHKGSISWIQWSIPAFVSVVALGLAIFK